MTVIEIATEKINNFFGQDKDYSVKFSVNKETLSVDEILFRDNERFIASCRATKKPVKDVFCDNEYGTVFLPSFFADNKNWSVMIIRKISAK